MVYQKNTKKLEINNARKIENLITFVLSNAQRTFCALSQIKVILLIKCISIRADNSFVADCMIQKEKVVEGCTYAITKATELVRYETSLPALPGIWKVWKSPV